MKNVFKFKLPNGDVGEAVTDADIVAYGLSATEETKRIGQLAHHYVSQAGIEKKWRNSEYAATDYMLLPYSRYKGEVLSGTTKLQDIVDYRDALYNYEYATEEARPTRPVWFN